MGTRRVHRPPIPPHRWPRPPPRAQDSLLSTGASVLAGASPLDRIRGSGLAAGDERATSPGHWPGLSLPGFALMEVWYQLPATAQTAPDSSVILAYGRAFVAWHPPTHRISERPKDWLPDGEYHQPQN